MTVENYLRIRKWKEPIGFGTGLGGADQKLSEVDGYLWIGMSELDFAEWLTLYYKKEMSFEEWLTQELRTHDLGVTPTQVCLDSTPRIQAGVVEFQVSVEDWECQD